MDAYDLQRGAGLVIELAIRANRYVVETEPWKLAKAKQDAALDVALASLVRAVTVLAVLAAPFIPVKAAELWDLLGSDRPLTSIRLADLAALAVAGWKVSKPPPLFPKPDAG
jgi:methionyl-tRNA synthetase